MELLKELLKIDTKTVIGFCIVDAAKRCHYLTDGNAEKKYSEVLTFIRHQAMDNYNLMEAVCGPILLRKIFNPEK